MRFPVKSEQEEGIGGYGPEHSSSQLEEGKGSVFPISAILWKIYKAISAGYRTKGSGGEGGVPDSFPDAYRSDHDSRRGFVVDNYVLRARLRGNEDGMNVPVDSER